MIYYMQSVDGGPVKIGYSSNVEKRCRQLEKRYGVKLVVLAVTEGDPEKEAEIHKRFNHLRFASVWKYGRRVEQFRPAADLMAFIGSPVLVPESPDSLDAMKPMRHMDSLFPPSRRIRRGIVAKVMVVVKCGTNWNGWFGRLAEHLGMSKADIVEEALTAFARQNKFPEVAPERFEEPPKD